MTLVADTPVLLQSPTDHSASIRAQIEADVVKLKLAFDRLVARWEADGWCPTYDESPIPSVVQIGYTINMHRGKDLYAEGDIIAGLPVEIDRQGSRSITVSCEEKLFESESWTEDEDGDETSSRVQEWRRPEASITW